MGGALARVTVVALLPINLFRNRALRPVEKDMALLPLWEWMLRLEQVSAATFRNAEILVEMYVVDFINLSLYNKL